MVELSARMTLSHIFNSWDTLIAMEDNLNVRFAITGRGQDTVSNQPIDSIEFQRRTWNFLMIG